MAIIRKGLKVGARGISNFFSNRKVIGAGTKGVVKTTSAVANQGVTTATAGGRTFLQSFGRGASKLAGTGGKVIAGTGLVAIPTGAGLFAYDKYKQSRSLTPEDRRLKFILDQQQRVLEQEGTAQALQQAKVQADPFGLGGYQVTDGSGFQGGFNPFGVYGDSPQQSSGTSPLLAIGGLLLIGGAGYLVYKNSKKRK